MEDGNLSALHVKVGANLQPADIILGQTRRRWKARSCSNTLAVCCFS